MPKQVEVWPKKRELDIQSDEMWSFVSNKGNKQWIWLALDMRTQEIVGVYVGNRSRDGARGLWQSLPSVYRQCAVCYTDFWEAYEQVIPKSRHRIVSKKSDQTSLIEEPIPLTLETRCKMWQEEGKHQNTLLGVPIEQRVFYTCVETKRKIALAGSEGQFP